MGAIGVDSCSVVPWHVWIIEVLINKRAAINFDVWCIVKTAYLHYYLYLPQNPALGKLSRPPRVCDGSGAKKEIKIYIIVIIPLL